MTQARYMRPGLDFAVGKAIEEMGELQAALGKTLRWGWESYNPELPPNQRESNRSWVEREMAAARHDPNRDVKTLEMICKALEDQTRTPKAKKRAGRKRSTKVP